MMPDIITFALNCYLQVWDLDRPFECDATLQILKFDDDEGKQVSEHLMDFSFTFSIVS